MKALLAAFGFYVHFLPLYFAGPAPDYRCGDAPGFRYCVYDPPYGIAQDPGSVVYFLHYGSGDERSWRRIPISRVFYAEFRKRGLAAPRVISVSYGPYWRVVATASGRLPSPMLSEFVDGTLPWLDRQFGRPRHRYLWGMSQGGLSAATLLFERPELWSGAVLSCPAIFSINIFAPPGKIAAFTAQNGLDEKKVRWGMSLVLSRVRGPKDWKREDPLELAQGKLARRLPPLYIEANEHDEFGFFLGARELVDELRKAGGAVAYREDPGGHCEVDAPAASAFVADLLQSSR